jgi:uncharacterized OB-fold protein
MSTSTPPSPYGAPLPVLEGLTKEFYAWCGRGELRFQRCGDCGSWRHVPRELCAACGSWRWEWARSSGRGTVYTWTVVARAMHPAFEHDVPYAAVIVELEEGVRILTRVVERAPDELVVGMPVEAVFEDVGPGVSLPRFRPRR